MKTHTVEKVSQTLGEVFTASAARRVGRGSGVLTVVTGCVWLSRAGDPDDHVLGSGREIRLQRADEAVIEPWQRGEASRLVWRPDLQPRRWRDLVTSTLGERLGVRRFGLGALWARLVDRTRNAASSASRAQGSIKAGESMASCGAVK
jgi:Protein of unknown function (DUF2917)